MPKRAILTLASVLILSFLACNNFKVSGFWDNYRRNLQVKYISRHNTDGGYGAIYWKSEKLKTFTTDDVLDFARKNGWQLHDSLKFKENQTSKWMYNRKPVFPLTSAGFNDTILNDAQLGYFPRWFDGPLIMYLCKSGWVSIEPGTGKSNEINGFVLINNEGTKMAVYYLWGQ